MLGKLEILFGFLCGALLSGCALGPDYVAPDVATSSGWSAPLPHDGKTDQLIGWWDRFNDPVLTTLLRQAEADSPSLAKAWANIEKSRATLTTDRAAGLPSLTADASGQRAKTVATTGNTAMTTTGNTLTGTLDASWEIDLFGKVRRNSEAAEARIEARVADWHDARVSLAAEVADDYVQYQACRQLAKAYGDTADSQKETARLTAISVKAGFTSASDGSLANASAASAASSFTAQQAECDILVKALVDLTGTPETALRPLLAQAPASLPQPEKFAVESVPANVLMRRPDLVSMERELAASSAEIGAAEANQLPDLSLSGSITRSGVNLSSLMTSWLFSAAASMPVFDGGQRAAAVDTAQASYDAQLATYKQGVRTAVKEVEQALVRLDSATRRSENMQTSSREYRQYYKSIDLYWQAGGASMLAREIARRDAVSADVTFITIQRDQIEYWIALYKAMGGGWQADMPAQAPAKAADKTNHTGEKS